MRNRRDGRGPWRSGFVGCLTTAATEGHLEILKWLVDQCLDSIDSTNVRGAARNGHLEVIKWLYKYKQYGDGTMIAAVCSGHLKIVQWCLNHFDRFSSDVMDQAATAGHLNIVIWLHNHRTEGCLLLEWMEPQKLGDLEVVK
ncbi:hypothetical protein PHMEG_00011377 [Phytophthora megakarya]|uniref:Serine/threonine protein kinase n=1 Tax=Phytophthora megakarya TaxID=4795 RepID=A0A225WBF4_9STRA|nr:hypothetical protein PHMEG_00011377 [Phytophthora megakarya]